MTGTTELRRAVTAGLAGYSLACEPTPAAIATFFSCGTLAPHSSLAWSRIGRKGLLCSTPPASPSPRCKTR